MNWFLLSLLTLFFWSGSDTFSKIGCRDASDRYSHLKMVLAVGTVMGLHALWQIFAGGVEISWRILLTYLPVSLLYILSMALGYMGLRYIELSVSSPICNCSGALVAVAAILCGNAGSMVPAQYIAVGMVCIGAVALGVVEATEDEDLRRQRQEKSNYKYAKSWLALALPVAYCLLDAAGTFADNLVLATLDEDSANVAYELTFFAAGMFSLAFLLAKKQVFQAKEEAPKYVGALFETAGQFTYIFAIADEQHLAMSAPIISAYCAASVLWGRLFLKERLSWKHYLAIAVIVVGIVIMGIYDM